MGLIYLGRGDRDGGGESGGVLLLESHFLNGVV